MLFLEAARMMKTKHPADVYFCVVSYLPVPSNVGEMKTKPTQMAVRTLNASGIQPDIIIARGEHRLDEKRKEKIAFMCNISPDRVISAPDVKSIYDVPENFEREHFSDLLCGLMGMKCSSKSSGDAKQWKNFTKKIHNSKAEVRIAVIGKYFETGEYLLADAYLSVIEAIKFSAYSQNRKPVLEWLNAFDFEKDPRKVSVLKKYDGIVIPGGFGSRGIEGKINVIRYARENKIPYFGLCYGMQLAVVEFARNAAKLEGAHTMEVEPKTPHHVIGIIENQKENLRNKRYGGSMRLGEYKAILKEGSIARKAYGTREILERHRHRYEVNPLYIDRIEKAGLVFSGKSPNGQLMEIAELPEKVHPFFVGVQFHPEFLARPLRPHPLFNAFIKACVKRKEK